MILKKIFEIIGIIFYVIAGFFITGFSFFAFSSYPTETMKAKFGTMGILSVPAVLLMIIGVACNRFKKWRTAVGTVLISGMCITVMGIITFICMRLDSNYDKFFKQQMLKQQMIERHKFSPDAFKSLPNNPFLSNPFDMFSDYVTGFGIMLVLLALGIWLVMSERKKIEQ